MPDANTLILLLAALATTAVGVSGGIGGAILLVSLLAVTGTPASLAAPLGMASVAAGSIAASATQLRARTVHHRLGVTTELAATTGATAGALLAGLVADGLITAVLAVAAVLAAASMLRPLGGAADGRMVPASAVGEWPGQIAGAATLDGKQTSAAADEDQDADAVAYRAKHLPTGLVAMGVTGLIAGLSGSSGGFIKTPVTSDLLGIPTKVAGATTTFTVGVTAAAGLVVMSLQGRVDARSAAAVIAGSLAGGRLGAMAQTRTPTEVIRRGLAIVLIVVAVLLLVRR